MAEIRENCPGVKLVLAALKCDLRKDEDMNDDPNAVSFDEGLAKAKEIGAVKYLGTIFFSYLTPSNGTADRDDLHQNALPSRTAESGKPSTRLPKSHSRLSPRGPKEAAHA